MKAQEINIETSRLTIDIPAELHLLIKAKATLARQSIKDYVVDALNGKLKNENKSKSGSKTIKAKMENHLSKRTVKILTNAKKSKKVTFKDTNSAMKYLIK